ncbi:MAG: alpha/beta hydrolase [Bacteroidota bacterium]|jgi:acetyl esterase/lipase
MLNISQPYTVCTYKYGSLTSQEGDLYLPQVSRPPVLCLLHGGFWRMPYGRDELTAMAKDLAARGYAVWNVEYRRLGAPGGGWPGTLHDVVSAIDHLATLVNDGIELDLNRVIVAGHSAGGHLALWVAARNKPANISSLVRVHPIAAAGLAAITDLARLCKLNTGKGAVNEFLGGPPSQYPDRYAAASPIELLPLGVRQLIIHGAKDKELPINLSRSYAAAAQASGDCVEFVELPDEGHMDFLDPGSKVHTTFCEWLATQAITV